MFDQDKLFTRKNIINLLLLGIMVLAIPLTIELARRQVIFFSLAGNDPVEVVVGGTVTEVNGVKYTSATSVKLKLDATRAFPASLVSDASDSNINFNPVGGLVGEVKAQNSTACEQASSDRSYCSNRHGSGSVCNLNNSSFSDGCTAPFGGSSSTATLTTCEQQEEAGDRNWCSRNHTSNSVCDPTKSSFSDGCTKSTLPPGQTRTVCEQKEDAAEPNYCFIQHGSGSVCDPSKASTGVFTDGCTPPSAPTTAGNDDGGSHTSAAPQGGTGGSSSVVCDPNDESNWESTGYSACVSTNPAVAAPIYWACGGPQWHVSEEVSSAQCGTADQTACWVGGGSGQTQASADSMCSQNYGVGSKCKVFTGELASSDHPDGCTNPSAPASSAGGTGASSNNLTDQTVCKPENITTQAAKDYLAGKGACSTSDWVWSCFDIPSQGANRAALMCAPKDCPNGGYFNPVSGQCQAGCNDNTEYLDINDGFKCKPLFVKNDPKNKCGDQINSINQTTVVDGIQMSCKCYSDGCQLIPVSGTTQTSCSNVKGSNGQDLKQGQTVCSNSNRYVCECSASGCTARAFGTCGDYTTPGSFSGTCNQAEYDRGHPQRCVDGRFKQCICDSQGCGWQHDNGACTAGDPNAKKAVGVVCSSASECSSNRCGVQQSDAGMTLIPTAYAQQPGKVLGEGCNTDSACRSGYCAGGAKDGFEASCICEPGASPDPQNNGYCIGGDPDRTKGGEGAQCGSDGSCKTGLRCVPVANSDYGKCTKASQVTVCLPGTGASGSRVTHYRIAESRPGLASATDKDYTGAGMETTYSFSDTTPGRKFVWVEFIEKDVAGNKVRSSEPFVAEVTLAGVAPSIASCSPTAEGNGTKITLTGTNFGATKGTATVDGSTVNPTSWTANSIVLNVGQKTGSMNVTITTPTSQTASITCAPGGVSDVSLIVKGLCRPTNSSLPSVNVKIAASGSAVVDQNNVGVGNDGKVVISDKAQKNKKNQILVKSYGYLAKKVEVTPVDGTVNAGIITLPAGDICPTPNGDGVINSIDKSCLNSQWLIDKAATGKSGDFNLDSRVNSLDWACMKLNDNFNKRDETIN